MSFNILIRKIITNQKINNWFGFGLMLVFFSITMYFYDYMVKELRQEEQKNVEVIVTALEIISSGEEVSDKTQEFALKIIENNTKIPLILINEKGEFTFQRNLDDIEDKLEQDSVFLKEKLNAMAESHEPIQVNLPFGAQKIYFENSFLLSQLKYYPLFSLFIVLLFSFFSIWYFKILQTSRLGFLWAGMAKETAHQIGTPLSSLLGWIELLKMENLSDDIVVDEMEKDVKRLNQIAQRFSKIGSEAELKEQNIVEVCLETFNYLQQRVSSQVTFMVHAPEKKIDAEFNKELLSWVIENLVKNAVDAMQNKGTLSLSVVSKGKEVHIKIKDTGSGLSPNQHKNIFEPGFTTKKRGWGLGLTLAKRIIEDYHHGKIFVLKTSELGTVFQITIPKKKPLKKGFLQRIKERGCNYL